MKKIFESVVLAEFVSNSGREPFMCFKAENGKEQKKRLLKAFFNNLIAPLYGGTDVEGEVKKMKPKEKADFAASVIDEAYRYIIEPNLGQDGETPDVSFAVSLMALYVVRHPRNEPWMCACEAVRLQTFAPICNPSLRPSRVRTFAEEMRLQNVCRRWKFGKSFLQYVQERLQALRWGCVFLNGGVGVVKPRLSPFPRKG